MVGLAVLSTLMLAACQAMGLFHQDVGATPAPTALPVPTVPSQSAPEVTASSSPQTDPTRGPVPTEGIPPKGEIDLPPGFAISVFVDGLNGPRMMTLGPDGHVYVAERGGERILRLPDRDDDGVVDEVEVAADELDAPSSLDFYKDGSLYVGETKRILRLSDPDGDGLFQEREVVIGGLPSGGHSTRTVLFSPDWEHLFVSIGSSCNVCVEEDERRATIMRYNPDGSEAMVYAEGLRNAVGITFRPSTSQLWATNNGRDWMGDNQPPETIYLVEEGDDAGWPRCHSGRIVDPEFGRPGACEGVEDPIVEMQAHTAPLGLTFYAGEHFPEEYRGNLFVAFHGSWNRSTPTGYKVVRVPIDDTQAGPVHDFAAGWLREDGSKWGRPVDVLTGPDGSLLISDDSEGFIYRIFYVGQ
jgi:glucose/arabinose dehydrogenase